MTIKQEVSPTDELKGVLDRALARSPAAERSDRTQRMVTAAAQGALGGRGLQRFFIRSAFSSDGVLFVSQRGRIL